MRRLQAAATDALSQILAAQEGILFFGYDTLAYPEKSVELTARMISFRSLEPQGVEGVSIGFYHDDELVEAAETDSDGRARITWTPPAPGHYWFEMKVLQWPEDAKAVELDPASLLVACYGQEKKLVVIDLDHTLVASSFARVLLGGAQRMPDSVRVTQRIAKDCGIVYLTDRPDLLAARSKQWLEQNDYPEGPVLLSTITNQFSGAGEFKTSKLSEVRDAYPNLKIGIGDKTSDAQAYVDNKLTAYLIPHYDSDDLQSMREKAEEISRIRGRGRLQVVSNWQQIEAGIFAGQTYPPERFIRQLLRQADQLEAQRRARHEEEEEEDDD